MEAKENRRERGKEGKGGKGWGSAGEILLPAQLRKSSSSWKNNVPQPEKGLNCRVGVSTFLGVTGVRGRTKASHICI